MKKDDRKLAPGKNSETTKVIQLHPERFQQQDVKAAPQNTIAELSTETNHAAEPCPAELPGIFSSPKSSQAKAMVALVSENATFFHTNQLETYALVDDGGIRKTMNLGSKTADLWLTNLVYKATGDVPNPQLIKTAKSILNAKAQFDGPELEVHLRYAALDGCIYIDLCDDQWCQVKISPEGHKVISSKGSPAIFRREKGMAPMCIPSEQGSFEPLRQFLNLESEADFIMIVSWLIGSMNPSGPFPIMVLVGEHGSSKSTTAKMLKDLTDPSIIDLVALPRNERELAIAAEKTWTLPYDNLSKLTNSLSDAFCRLSTGGGFRTRTLYKNDSEMLFTSIRPLIMNGISDFVTRQDLANRSIIIHLPSISKDKRIREKELFKQWSQVKPQIFGAVCKALSNALRNKAAVNLDHYPRMADFAFLVSAAESVLPWEQGAFLTAYTENQKNVMEIAIEADEIALAVMTLADQTKNGEWTGKATDLKEVLETFVEDRVIRQKSWPKQANALSNRIRRCASFLRAKGIEIERGKSGDRYISIRKIVENTAQIVQKERESKVVELAKVKTMSFSDDGDSEYEEGEI